MMYEEFTRKMNEQEIADLKQRLTPRSITYAILTDIATALFCCLLMVVVCAAAIAVLDWDPGVIVSTLSLWSLGILGILLFFILINSLEAIPREIASKKYRNQQMPQIQDALAEGTVDVRRFVAHEVIEITEWEDEDPSGYLFDIGNENTLFLIGQIYYPDSSDAPWPNTEFEIARTTRHQLWMGLSCQGEELVPSQTLESEDCRDEIVWEEREEIIQANLSAHARSLLKPAL